MKQLLIEVDADLWAELERVAPARSRRRSEFVRKAIVKAIMEEKERHTEAAYRKQPQADAEISFDPAVWEPKKKRPR